MPIQELVHSHIDGIVVLAKSLLIPAMLVVFFIGLFMRGLIYYTVRREEYFTKEFEKRIDNFLEDYQDKTNLSFFHVAKRLLMITYYELYEVTALLQRRKPDIVLSISDRIFLTKPGFAWLVKDILKQVRYFKYDGSNPEFINVAKTTFKNNPCFSRLFGVIPISGMNEVLSVLPGLFIVGGIFGTFLGIVHALPQLHSLDLADVEGSKRTMDAFLASISLSMISSTIGIFLSVCFTLYNALLSPHKIFVNAVEKLETGLDKIWHRCEINSLKENTIDFDQNKNPLVALAEEALNQEYARATGGRKTHVDKDPTPKAS